MGKCRDKAAAERKNNAGGCKQQVWRWGDDNPAEREQRAGVEWRFEVSCFNTGQDA